MATPTVETKIWLALREHLEALVLEPVLPFLWPGQNVDLPPGNALEVNYLVNRPSRVFIGSNCPHDRRGILQVGVLAPLSSNVHHETVVREIAGMIAGHFVVDAPLRYQGVTVRVYEAPEVSGSFKDDARNRWVTPVSARWSCWA